MGSSYTYIYQQKYGSPEIDPQLLVVTSATLLEDGKSVRLHCTGLRERYVDELSVTGIRSRAGDPIPSRQRPGSEGDPFPRTSVSLGFAQNETTESNIAGPWLEFIKERLPVWARHADQLLHNSTTVTMRELLTFAVQNWNYIRMVEGQPNYQERKYRMNLTARHSFDGRLKGAFVGGNYRWFSPSTAGFRPITITDNPFIVPGILGSDIVVNDLDNRIEGKAQTTLDAFAGYSRSIFDHKVKWRLQLNVRNVLGMDDLYMQRSFSTGEGSIYTLPRPRTFILSSSFTF